MVNAGINIIKIIFIIIFLCFIYCLHGCSCDNNLKDNILKGYNNVIENASGFALSKDSMLNGSRKFGVDRYTGSYSASYKDFNGKEVIFGGTSLERSYGNKLKAVYTLKVSSGDAMVYQVTAGEEYLIASGNADGVYKFTIDPGDNYIVLKGKDFSGTLELVVNGSEKDEI